MNISAAVNIVSAMTIHNLSNQFLLTEVYQLEKRGCKKTPLEKNRPDREV